jgi:hypothetical protein
MAFPRLNLHTLRIEGLSDRPQPAWNLVIYGRTSCAPLNNTELLVLATVRRIEEGVAADAGGSDAVILVGKHQTELTKLAEEGLIVRQPAGSSWSVTEKGEAVLRAHQVRLERVMARLSGRGDVF